MRNGRFSCWVHSFSDRLCCFRCYWIGPNRLSEWSEEYCEPRTAGWVVSDLGTQCSFISLLWWRVFSLCFYCRLCGTALLFSFLLHDKLSERINFSFRFLTQTRQSIFVSYYFWWNDGSLVLAVRFYTSSNVFQYIFKQPVTATVHFADTKLRITVQPITHTLHMSAFLEWLLL